MSLSEAGPWTTCSSRRLLNTMAILHAVLSAVVFCLPLGSAGSLCESRCSCTEEPFGWSLYCTELPSGRFPQNMTKNLMKVRIENSHLTEIPQAAFSAVSALTFLWLNFNNITLMNVRSLEGLHNLTELRIQGNKLRSIPWTAFRDTANLEILDLKDNLIDALPEHALRLLPRLTYLDLSFNQLTVVSRDVFGGWTPGVRDQQESVVLALHENRWLCDCRLKGFVEFINTIGPPMILMNSYMTCSGPESRAGRFFHELELKTCLKPDTSSPQSELSLPVGSSVALSCWVTSRPAALVHWSYSLKAIRAFSVSQTSVSDDTVRYELIIPAVHASDRGLYTCTANNFIGNSSISIQLDVLLSSNSTVPHSASFPLASADENTHIDVHIAKQTVNGITIEWFVRTEKPAETWYTVYFGRHNASKREAVHMGPGSSSYTVSDLLPLMKYEVCVAVKNQPPRERQCVVFVTGSDVKQLERTGKLIHVIVAVCALMLAVPVGMCACMSDTRVHCCELCTRLYDTHETFHSLQAASDGASGHVKTVKRSEKGNSSAQLY